MSTSEKHSESDRASRESEVRQQEERAKVYLELKKKTYILVTKYRTGRRREIFK